MESVSHADCFHARVGHRQASQIVDPRGSEWQHALDAHLVWWDRIVAVKRAAGQGVLYACPEFGPYPYLAKLPFSRSPIADLWEINPWV